MTIDNKENGDRIVTTNRNNKLTERIVKKAKLAIVCVHHFRKKNKGKHSSKKLGKNRPDATAWKDDTSEQTKKVIILGCSIVKHIRKYDFLHSLENCRVHEKNFPGVMV